MIRCSVGARSARGRLLARAGRFSVLLGLVVAAMALNAPRLARASQPAQEAANLSVIVTAYADVTGGGDPACPACDGEYGDADEAFALAHPLSPLRFEIRNADGLAVGQGMTSALGGMQTARLSVPAPSDGTRYDAVLVETPADWMLCFDDSATRTFDAADAGPDGVRVSWRFYAGCERDAAPEPSPEPSQVPPTELPTALPDATAPAVIATPEPTAAPSGGERTEPSSSEGRAPVAGGPPAQAPARAAQTPRDAEGRLGSLRGRAFFDADADGRRDADEAGMADVGVHLHGGGLQLMLITDATGEFGFDALGAGEYELFVAPGPEWRVTTPERRSMRVAGETQLDLDFGLSPSASAPVMDAPAGAASVGESLPRLPATGADGLRPATPLAALGLGMALLAVLGASRAAGRKEACL